MMQIIPLLDALSGGGVISNCSIVDDREFYLCPRVKQLLKGIEPELVEVIIVDRNTEVLKRSRCCFRYS